MELLSLILVTFAISAGITPLAAWIGRRLNAVSRPDGQRRLQATPIPQAGGIAVCTSLVSAFFLTSVFLPGAISPSIIATVVSACLLCLLGLVDDVVELSGKLRLPLQFACILPTLTALPLASSWQLLSWEISLGPFAVVIASLWLMASINATNLIDGLDGLASSCAVIIAGFTGVVAWQTGNMQLAGVSLVTAACCGGFLVHNLPPAKIYLGDCGSTLIGFLLGVVAWQASLSGSASINLSIACLLLFLPLYDTVLAMTRRLVQGKSIFAADRGHIHHCLQDRLSSSWKTLGVLVAIATWGCALAAIASLPAGEGISWALLVATIAIFTLCRVAGFAEMMLIVEAVQKVARKPVWFSPSVRYMELTEDEPDEAVEPVFNKAA
jgi:UDP-GlcNAc:undecaprenyl-phosphate GlcNAc-1-phosphate transferase